MANISTPYVRRYLLPVFARACSTRFDVLIHFSHFTSLGPSHGWPSTSFDISLAFGWTTMWEDEPVLHEIGTLY